MVVEKLRELLAQALVLLALMTEQHGALEQLLLQILRQFAPQICGGSTEHEKIASGNVVDDLIGMLAHWRTHNRETARVCSIDVGLRGIIQKAAFKKPRAPSPILVLLPT